MMMRTIELMFITWVVLLQVAVAEKGGCRVQKCGNLTIHYPFRIDPIHYPFRIDHDCYLDKRWGNFTVKCNHGVATLAAEGSSHNFTIKEIRLPNQVLLETSELMAVDCWNNVSKANATISEAFNKTITIRLPDPFTVSSRGNRFRAMGCDTRAYINNTEDPFRFRSQCETQWMLSRAGVRNGGLGQCDIAVPEGSTGYTYNVTNQFNYRVSACRRNCSYAFLADEKYEINGMVLDNYVVDEEKKMVNGSIKFPLVGEWVIKDTNCDKNHSSPTCGHNAFCNYTSTKSGYNCYCNDGYKGNPYINATGTAGGCRREGKRLVFVIAFVGGFALAAKLLEKLASSADTPDTAVDPDTFQDINDPTLDGDADPSLEGEGDPDGGPDDPKEGDNPPKLFNQQDLKKAIKLYQKGRRVALCARRRMVAGANLANNQAVEIRKYIVQDRAQLEPFVKGVRTLSRTVIHPNVARLLGISTRDSSLIYRYFSDQTLHDRLHSSQTDPPSWEERLKIAVEAARGLAFAHSKGIYHGNVKSTNILLDENCHCKVVDFGVVRVWRRNKLLNSSKGYVDPEYLNQSTNRLTLTSTMDVYSLGVVLVELLTGKDPSAEASNQKGRSLAMQFKLAVKERPLEDLVDSRIWAEERRKQLEEVAEIATQCLEAKDDRPKMLVVRDKLWKSALQLRARAANPAAEQNDNPQGQDDSGVNPSGNLEDESEKVDDQDNEEGEE